MQVIAVTMMVVLNALDGFDVLSISFASPGIAREWGIDRAALGVVLAMELIGMAIGSVLLGRLSDRIGRRQTMLICLVIMTVGMFMVTTVSTITELSVWRVITGKHLNVSLTTIGYPIGAVIGGTIAAQLLKTYDWRSVFYLGTAISCPNLSIGWRTSALPGRWKRSIRRSSAWATEQSRLYRISRKVITSGRWQAFSRLLLSPQRSWSRWRISSTSRPFIS
jgi:MFS family permease